LIQTCYLVLSQQVNVTSLAWMSKKGLLRLRSDDQKIRAASSQVRRASGDFISSRFFLQDEDCLLARNSKQQQQQQQQQQHQQQHHRNQIKRVIDLKQQLSNNGTASVLTTYRCWYNKHASNQREDSHGLDCPTLLAGSPPNQPQTLKPLLKSLKRKFRSERVWITHGPTSQSRVSWKDCNYLLLYGLTFVKRKR